MLEYEYNVDGRKDVKLTIKKKYKEWDSDSIQKEALRILVEDLGEDGKLVMRVQHWEAPFGDTRVMIELSVHRTNRVSKGSGMR